MADIELAPERNTTGVSGGLAYTIADRNLVIVAWGAWDETQFDQIIVGHMAHHQRVNDWDYNVLPNGMEIWVIGLGGEHAQS